MSDIVRCRIGATPSVEVAAIVACGDEAPQGLRQLARELRAAADWLESRHRRRRVLRRQIEELEASEG